MPLPLSSAWVLVVFIVTVSYLTYSTCVYNGSKRKLCVQGEVWLVTSQLSDKLSMSCLYHKITSRNSPHLKKGPSMKVFRPLKFSKEESAVVKKTKNYDIMYCNDQTSYSYVTGLYGRFDRSITQQTLSKQ